MWSVVQIHPGGPNEKEMKKIYLAKITEYVIFMSDGKWQTMDEQRFEIEGHFHQQLKEGLVGECEVKQIKSLNSIPKHLQDEVPWGDTRIVKEILSDTMKKKVKFIGDTVIIDGIEYTKT